MTHLRDVEAAVVVLLPALGALDHAWLLDGAAQAAAVRHSPQGLELLGQVRLIIIINHNQTPTHTTTPSA